MSLSGTFDMVCSRNICSVVGERECSASFVTFPHSHFPFILSGSMSLCSNIVGVKTL